MSRSKSDITSIVKEAINEFFLDKEFISKITKKITDTIEQKIKDLEEDIKNQNNKILEFEQKTSILQQEMDTLYQREKRNNICIYGVPEENSEQLARKMLNIFKSKTSMKLNENDILNIYRIGKRHDTQDKPRPLIMTLSKPELKHDILKCRSKFKGTHIFFADDLTKLRRTLLMEARSEYGVKNAWSYDGQVYANINGKNTKITSMTLFRK